MKFHWVEAAIAYINLWAQGVAVDAARDNNFGSLWTPCEAMAAPPLHSKIATAG